MRDGDAHGAHELHERVAQRLEHDRLSAVVRAAVTEVQLGHTEDADVFAEHVVAVDEQGAEIARRLEGEDNLHGFAGHRVVLPADPLVALFAEAVAVEAEVGDALLPVAQLPEPPGEAAAVAVRFAVVGEIGHVNLGPSFVALWHVVREQPICIRKKGPWRDQHRPQAFQMCAFHFVSRISCLTEIELASFESWSRGDSHAEREVGGKIEETDGPIVFRLLHRLSADVHSHSVAIATSPYTHQTISRLITTTS